MTVGPPVEESSVDALPEHDLLVVDTDEQLLVAEAGYLGHGLADGDVMRARLPGWLVDELAPRLPGVAFAVSETAVWRREPDQIVAIRKTLADCAPRRLRLMGLSTAPEARPWDERCRCEAITTLAYRGSPLSILCVYARRTTPAPALAAAEATHPHL